MGETVHHLNAVSSNGYDRWDGWASRPWK